MSIKIYFGVPGSGKTTHAAKVVLNNLKHGIRTFSNVRIVGSIYYNASDIGKIDMSNADMIIDEASIEFNNRAYKSLPKQTIEWFKLSRHYGIRNIYVYSQSYDDMDITLRRLADELFVVRRSLIPYLFSTRRIRVKIGIDENTHQVIDQYFFQRLGINFYFGWHYWHMFDSWEAPALPVRNWYLSGFPNADTDRKSLKKVGKCLALESHLYYKIARILKKLCSRKIEQNKK